MFSARAPDAVRSVVRCQVRPSGEVQITAWVVPPAAVSPAARYPSAVLVTTQTWSPGSCGSMPCVAARVQVRPFGLVQVACEPIASQPPGRVPERGLPAARRVHRGQLPACPAVGGHEELLAGDAAAGLRADGHD